MGERGNMCTILLSSQLLLLSYRLEYGFTSLSPQLQLKCRLVRVAAHAMSLLLAIHLDYDTERRYSFLIIGKGALGFTIKFLSRMKWCLLYNEASSTQPVGKA